MREYILKNNFGINFEKVKNIEKLKAKIRYKLSISLEINQNLSWTLKMLPKKVFM